MVTISELKRLIAKEKKLEAKKRKDMEEVEEKAKLKRQLFNLKYGKKVKTLGKRVKNVRRNIASNFKGLSGDFNKSRKKKTGIGGFMQRIADNQ